MERELRNKIRSMVTQARAILEEDAAEQLEGTYGIYPDGSVDPANKLPQLDDAGLEIREELLGAIEHEEAKGLGRKGAVWRFARQTAFTHLNRLVALRLFEAPERGLIRESLTKGEASRGFREFQRFFPIFRTHDPDGGYQRYLELLIDEAASEVRILFDRSDPHSILFPSPTTLKQVARLLQAPKLDRVWGDDETLGWVYQYFNGDDRDEIRDTKNKRTKGKPQTSEDLAIINQFFTPNYVVRFLVDNTLGRLWWEMHPHTELVNEWEYLIIRPDEEPGHREPKPPEEIKVLDPAVGSGHFLLYCFDVLARIYETEGYDRREIPGLILKHNLHGVDIDARASQIAALSLYLKAKKYHKDATVTTTNIVDAEPLPDDQETLEAFLKRVDSPVFERVVKATWKELQVAGHAGSLLKTEETIRELLKQEQEHLTAWQEGAEGAFWQEALDTIFDAFHHFYDKAEASDLITWRLFAAEGEQGFRLLNVLRKRYDVVVMNPPYGDGTPDCREYLNKNYPITKNDLYAAFVERGLDWTRPHGFLGALTSRTGFFLKTFQKWRKQIILPKSHMVCMADLGMGVLDGAMVEVAAYVLESMPGGSTP